MKEKRWTKHLTVVITLLLSLFAVIAASLIGTKISLSDNNPLAGEDQKNLVKQLSAHKGSNTIQGKRFELIREIRGRGAMAPWTPFHGGGNQMYQQEYEKLLDTACSQEGSSAIEELKNLINVIQWKDEKAVMCLYQKQMANDELKAAVETLQKAKDVGVLTEASSIILAETMSLDGRNYEAEDIAMKVLKKKPTNIEALETYQNILKNAGRNDEIISYFEHLSASYPADGNLVVKLASLYREAEDIAKSVEVLQSGIRRNPDDPELERSLADMFMAQERYEEAALLYQKYISREPEEAYGYLQLAQSYEQMGFTKEAMDYYHIAELKSASAGN